VQKLRQWREFRALTQEELAERAGISPRSVAGYEGGAGARPATVRALATALDIDVSALLEEPEAPKGRSRPSPAAPEDQAGGERLATKRFRAEELEREESLLKAHNERRQRQIDGYDQENAPLPEHEWWSEAAALEHNLTEEYEERGILGFAEALAKNRMSANFPEQRASVRFLRELALMRSLVDEAQVMVGAAQSLLHHQGTKFRSKLSAPEPDELKARSIEVRD